MVECCCLFAIRYKSSVKWLTGKSTRAIFIHLLKRCINFFVWAELLVVALNRHENGAAVCLKGHATFWTVLVVIYDLTLNMNMFYLFWRLTDTSTWHIFTQKQISLCLSNSLKNVGWFLFCFFLWIYSIDASLMDTICSPFPSQTKYLTFILLTAIQFLSKINFFGFKFQTLNTKYLPIWIYYNIHKKC